MRFSPTSNMIVAGCWDSKIYYWNVESNGDATPKAALKHDSAVLCVDWSPDGTRIVSGSCDKTAKMWSVETKQGQQIAAHDKPIKEIFWIPTLNVVATGSWDKTLKYWDTRTQNPVGTVKLSERVYCMDVVHPLAVVATADKSIHILNLSSPMKIFRTQASPLKYQPRCVACFPDKSGFAVGSIEGRVGINYVDEKYKSLNFAFKCHRSDPQVYSVNNISFHKFGTFATAGSDGTYVYWDKDSKHRLKLFDRMPNSITTATFNKEGRIYAYAMGYDWSKGAEGYDRSKPNQIMLHCVKEEDVRPKEKKNNNRF